MSSSPKSAPNQPRKAINRPLCVDLDGTLLKTDLLWECFVDVLRTRPWLLILVPYWLISGGKAGLKRRLASAANVQANRLPYFGEVIQYLHDEKAQGREIVLVTAADEELARSIADFIGIFDAVHGSREGVNLRGPKKAELLCRIFGPEGFDYVGNSASDFPVWASSESALVVGPDTIAEQTAALAAIEKHFPVPDNNFRVWLDALRPHHWSKNVLLFLPVLLAHNLQSWSIAATALGAALFSLCSSGVYLFNDILDIHSDRTHPWKRYRPFASGELSIPSGLAISMVLILASISCGGYMIGTGFASVLVVYSFMTSLYSLRLKRIVLIDMFALSSFYTIRIWAGAIITHTLLSQWFLGFSLFLFLSLAGVKRVSELSQIEGVSGQSTSGRGYTIADKEILSMAGIASGFAAIVILSLYIHSTAVIALYARADLLLLLCPLLLYWILRLWLVASRGNLSKDPVVFAFEDPVSYLVGAIAFLVVILSAPLGLTG